MSQKKKKNANRAFEMYARSYECYYAFGDVFYRHTKMWHKYMGLFIFKLQIKSS